jgi:hypothetical protein
MRAICREAYPRIDKKNIAVGIRKYCIEHKNDLGLYVGEAGSRTDQNNSFNTALSEFRKLVKRYDFLQNYITRNSIYLKTLEDECGVCSKSKKRAKRKKT